MGFGATNYSNLKHFRNSYVFFLLPTFFQPNGFLRCVFWAQKIRNGFVLGFCWACLGYVFNTVGNRRFKLCCRKLPLSQKMPFVWRVPYELPMDSAGKRQVSPLGTSQVVTKFSVLEINRHALCQWSADGAYQNTPSEWLILLFQCADGRVFSSCGRPFLL